MLAKAVTLLSSPMMKTECVLRFLAIAAFISGTAEAQYPGWKNTGSLFLNTTPDGANLPATASGDGFPVLVRLHKDFFQFAEVTMVLSLVISRLMFAPSFFASLP